MSEKKQEKDFTAEVDALLPEATSLAKVRARSDVAPPRGALMRQTCAGGQAGRGGRQAARAREADA
jgi:hypothetical protein